MKKSETVLFFGSGPVAAESLRLLAQDFEIEAVVTKPRPAHHKGAVPVLELAKELNLPIMTVRNRQELDDLFATNPAKSRLGILVDFGIIVSQKVIDYFLLGIINSHFSLLPEWRGADPITFSILSGQKITGVSLMMLVAAMDEGPLLGYGEYELPDDITTPQLTDDLIQLSHSLLQEMVPGYINDEIIAQPQAITGREVSYSKKLTKEDGILDWSKSAEQLEREVRAYAGWPRSRTEVNGLSVVITKAHVQAGSGPAGQTWKDGKQFGFYATDGILIIDSLVPAGKKEMPATAFLAGYQV